MTKCPWCEKFSIMDNFQHYGECFMERFKINLTTEEQEIIFGYATQ